MNQYKSIGYKKKEGVNSASKVRFEVRRDFEHIQGLGAFGHEVGI